MKPTGIFYGSLTGQTRAAANRIASVLGIKPEDVHDVGSTAPSVVGPYTNLILGSSTWGDGDLEESWADFIDGLQALDLKGKQIALFGCGDTSMTENFCNAVGILHDRLADTGANFIGTGFNTEGLDFASSRAVKGGLAEGLLLDNVNHPELTDSRIDDWCAALAPQL